MDKKCKAHESYKVYVEGGGGCMSSFCEDLSPLELARKLCDMEMAGPLPDSARVAVCECSTEEYLPPRCRKPRTRLLETKIAQFTLADLRFCPEQGHENLSPK